MIKNLVENVWRTLGPGYTERIYHNALEVMLRKHGIAYETERIIPIIFENHVIGNLRADLIVAGSLIVELKSTRTLTAACRTQIQTYMHLLGITEGLLVKFWFRTRTANGTSLWNTWPISSCPLFQSSWISVALLHSHDSSLQMRSSIHDNRIRVRFLEADLAVF